MQSLPFLVSLGVAVGVVPAAVQGLRTQGFVRQNYRGAEVAFPAGIGIVASALVALIPLALIDELGDSNVFTANAGIAVAYVLAVALLGLLDDLIGSTREDQPRGWRGHARASTCCRSRCSCSPPTSSTFSTCGRAVRSRR